MVILARYGHLPTMSFASTLTQHGCSLAVLTAVSMSMTFQIPVISRGSHLPLHARRWPDVAVIRLTYRCLACKSLKFEWPGTLPSHVCLICIVFLHVSTIQVQVI